MWVSAVPCRPKVWAGGPGTCLSFAVYLIAWLYLAVLCTSLQLVYLGGRLYVLAYAPLTWFGGENTALSEHPFKWALFFVLAVCFLGVVGLLVRRGYAFYQFSMLFTMVKHKYQRDLDYDELLGMLEEKAKANNSRRVMPIQGEDGTRAA